MILRDNLHRDCSRHGSVTSPTRLSPNHTTRHGLSPEILIRIVPFIVLAEVSEISYCFPKLTHVCRYWRSTLVNHPRAIYATDRERRNFVEMFLQRSLDLLLDVRVAGWEDTHGLPSELSKAEAFIRGPPRGVSGSRVSKGEVPSRFFTQERRL